LKSYQITINDQSYAVEIEDLSATPIRVRVNGELFSVKLEEGPPAAQSPLKLARAAAPAPLPSAARSPAASPNTNIVAAPMPGVIMDIRVAAGQEVARGQELCILEAMKMRNSLRAPRAGVIAEIKVSEGQTVGHGEALFVFGRGASQADEDRGEEQFV